MQTPPEARLKHSLTVARWNVKNAARVI